MKKSLLEKLVIGFSIISVLVLLGSLITILAFLFFNGFSAINLTLFFGDTTTLDALLLRKQVFDGLLPAIVGTSLLILFSICLAIPVGVATGIYLSEYCFGKRKKIFGIFIDVLAGIPSIMVGLFGFSIAIFLHKYFSENIYPCLLISSLSLAFLVLPYLIRTTQLSLENLPQDVRLTGVVLGATKLQNIFYILLPRALSGIMSGVILSIGRCAEDTAVIMLTGVVATAGIPKSIFSSFEALPFYIYYISSQYSTQAELDSGYAAALILLGICLFFFLFSFVIKNRLNNHTLYRR